MSKTLAVVAALLLVAAGAAAQSGTVEIRDAWARATPGKADIGAVYLTLESPTADRLTGLSTPIAGVTQLHTTTMEGGVKKMNRVAALDLSAGQKIKLEPGAMHIMLIGLTDRLRQGQSFLLTLYFEKAGTREITVSVEEAGSTGPEKTTSGDMKLPTPAEH
jgi:periplasmic copper chaperone A